jgi:hypothetical protein
MIGLLYGYRRCRRKDAETRIFLAAVAEAGGWARIARRGSMGGCSVRDGNGSTAAIFKAFVIMLLRHGAGAD